MKQNRFIFSFIFSFLSICLFSEDLSLTGKWKLWYDKPAKNWDEALPIGNGRIGGMVHGGIKREIVQLNEDTIWAGSKADQPLKKNAYQIYSKAEKMFFEGKAFEAEKLIGKEFLAKSLVRSYQTMADLDLYFMKIDELKVKNYKRSLDLETGIAQTVFDHEGIRYTRDVFVSEVDQVLMMTLSSSAKGAINTRLKLNRYVGAKIKYEKDSIVLNARAYHLKNYDERLARRAIIHPNFKYNRKQLVEKIKLKGVAFEKEYWGKIKRADQSGWQKEYYLPSFNDSKWDEITLPYKWGEEKVSFTGIKWYRKRIVIPDSWEGKDLKLFLGELNGSDETWFNGQKVGVSILPGEKRLYDIPAKLVKKGKAVLTLVTFHAGYIFGAGYETKFQSGKEACEIYPQGNKKQALALSGNWKRAKMKSDKKYQFKKGVRFNTRLKVKTVSGNIVKKKDYLEIKNADKVFIYLTAGTDFYKENWVKSLFYKALSLFNSNFTLPARKAGKDMKHVLSKSFEKVKLKGIGSHFKLFKRVKLDFGGHEARKKPTDKRLSLLKQGKADPDLLALYFHYGRYLLIASSRPNTQPANLQGIWCFNLVKGQWNSDYHINVNLQMNYWPAQMFQLAECHLPYFDLIDRVSKRGAKVAKYYYNARGWMAHQATDIWAYAIAQGRPGYAFFQYGGAWATRQYWEYYQYTQDKEFLRKRAFPILKGASKFLLDYLIVHPKTGELVARLSNSPENKFVLPNNKKMNISPGASMSQLITLDTFENFINAAAVLEKENDATVKEVKKALQKLAFPKIGEDGRVMEWYEDYKEANLGHRHVSHLYALHPAAHFFDREGYVEAARKSLETRLAHGGGHTGWSRAWIINFWARLKSAEKSYNNLILILKKSTLPNLFDDHPPFQIDGNFGAIAGMGEMLLQSHQLISVEGNKIHLLDVLPALSSSLSKGSFKGFKTRGNVIVDLDWSDKKPTKLRLSSTKNNAGYLAFKLPKGVSVAQIQSKDKISLQKKENIFLLKIENEGSFSVDVFCE